MTEVPEHLLARSQARRAALGLGGDAPATAAAPAAGSAPATTGASAAAAPAGKVPAPITAGAPPAPPAPPPPYVQAALARKRIPIWAMPVLAFLPLWGLIYVQTLEPPPATEVTVLAEGAELYAANCAACHLGNGGGGAGRQLSNGEVLLTFPNILDQVQFVRNGTAGFLDEPYGNPDRPGGAHVGGSFGNMPGFPTLTDQEILAIVRYEREVLSGEELPEGVTLGPLEELIGSEGTELFLFDDAGHMVDAEGEPVFSESGWLLEANADLAAELSETPASVYPEKAAA